MNDRIAIYEIYNRILRKVMDSMKIDRLIGIIMYLLNRDKVTAKELAERFEVSTRTIIRDIDALGLAGIPVVSDVGVKGGYAILDTYKLNKSIVTAEDYLNVISSLKGMCSAYENKKIEATLEKVMAAGNTTGNQSIFLDLSVCREGENTDVYLKTIEQAIADKRVIGFDYTGADNVCNAREAEPVALSYKWYAWYLLAYCKYKKDYRIFKLSRIQNLKTLERNFEKIHSNIETLLEKKWGEDDRKQYEIKLKCEGSVRTAVGEYLKGKVIEEYPNGDFTYSFAVPENERMWFSLLLGFGSEVEVLEPKELRVRLKEKSEEIFRLYHNEGI